ncbi:hypothetical protein QBZ16_004863 [Prototheca wickerhamii]|uniref:inorganic diphosphatase n=1 Tax=Prototheca wickerhamii TaxID=3111 RepID=A0AAD9IHH0_PROWI|nr:hypothetical protein QBZ16_004863 [Prototheca wickerhamii]
MRSICLVLALGLALVGLCVGQSVLKTTEWGFEQDGIPETWGFEGFITADNFTVSPWHNVPLIAGTGLHSFIVEMPKDSSAKFEVQTEAPLNPIKQDLTDAGELRYYHSNLTWNYGLLPQTWEDPAFVNPEVNATGDNDPTDVVEIGSTRFATGDIVPVKILGAFALLDQTELDWKVIAIAAEDPLAEEVNDILDVDRVMPGRLAEIREFYRTSKVPDGKPENSFGFDEKPLSREYTLGVVSQTHGFWLSLVSGARDNTEGKSLF